MMVAFVGSSHFSYAAEFRITYLACVCAEVGEVLAEAEVLCTAMLENRVFDRLYSLIKLVCETRWKG